MGVVKCLNSAFIISVVLKLIKFYCPRGNSRAVLTKLSNQKGVIRSILNFSFLTYGEMRSDAMDGLDLDERQILALAVIAQDDPKLVMLQGDFGTGKTLLLMEALRIKISHCQERGEKLKVIMTTHTKQELLIDLLKTKYTFDDVETYYYNCFKDVPVKDNIGILGQVNSVANLNSCVKRLGRSNRGTKVIVAIDEFFIKGKQDWNKYESHENVDLLLAFHPRKDPRFPFILPRHDNPKVFHCTLNTTHRNSYQVLQFCSFLSSHAPLFTESSSAKSYQFLPKKSIEQVKDLLLHGQTPIWIELEQELVHPVMILRYLKDKHLKEAAGVSFIMDDSHSHSQDVKKWIKENGYQQHTASEFAQVSFSFGQSMRGLEDEVNLIGN